MVPVVIYDDTLTPLFNFFVREAGMPWMLALVLVVIKVGFCVGRIVLHRVGCPGEDES